ncbi:MAG: S-layer homology domain-containing protein [Armatimonadetes bacterium]|nr:S-layer homology domain-containing protein [Armatimonadota bacterium]
MFNQRCFYRLVITLILALAVCPVFSQGREAFAAARFSDVRGHWAEQSILEMSAYEIVRGYPDGTFKPNADIAFQEAIVMIMNTLGWGEEAAKADLAGLTFPAGTWAKGYFALAVKKGMLTEGGLPLLDPKRPATRLEVASLLCLALGFEPDYTSLNFQDAGEIDENYRGYVGAIVKRGIMIGLPGNLFAPGAKITRAQMCTMLSRLIEQNLTAPPPPRKRLVARITGVDEDDKTITVRNLSGEKTFEIPGDCPLFKDREIIGPGSLSKSSRIKLITDEERAYYGSLLSDFGSAEKTVEGFLVSVSSGGVNQAYSITLETGTGEKLRFELYEDARLLDGDKELTAADLKRDSFLQVELDANNKIFAGEVLRPDTISGTIIEIDRDQLTIKRRGVKEDYQISKNVRVTKNTLRSLSLSDLKPGDYVNIVVLGDRVFSIDCLSDAVAELSGMVSKIRGDSIYIYVQNEEKRYDLDTGLEVYKDGRHKDLADLKRGDYITFCVADNQKVISIEMLDEEEGEFTGTVLYLGTTNQPYITLRMEGGLELDYDIYRSATILRNGDEINLEDVVPGAKVRIEVDEGKVDEIEVLDDRNITVEGMIVNVNEEEDRLTLEINGRKYNYDLAGDVVVLDADGKKAEILDLKNYRVEAKLEDGVIQKIEVKD